MSEAGDTAITLRALDGEPLADAGIKQMIVATAHAIAERQGVTVLGVKTTPSSITVMLQAGRIEALGLAAELRRLTNNWYAAKFNEPTLWGETPEEDPDAGEDWKRA
jgi:hypothetical protein